MPKLGSATAFLALGAVLWAGAASAQSRGEAKGDPPVPPGIIGPSVVNADPAQTHKTPVGTFRQILKGPTATLDQLEVHETQLNPGKWSHPPHRHANEELVIIRQGTVETLSGGVWKRAGPGSVILNASNSLHALKNVGTVPALYTVVNWQAAPKK